MDAVRPRLERMEYQSVQGLEELSAFVAVVQAHGFTAAARATRARKATLSRRVRDLEARLGVSLMARTTRSLRLTEEGRAYFEHAQRSLAAARDAEAAVRSAKAKPSGVLRITTSTALAGQLVDRVIAEYLSRHREVAVELDSSERRIDLVAENFDLAVRAGPLEDSSLVARRIGVATGGFYASPRYLASRGTPAHPKQILAHDTIAIVKPELAMEWPFFIGGKRKLLPLRPRLIVTQLDTAARAAASGLGIVRAPLEVVQPYLEKGELVAVLGEWTLPGVEVHAVFPPGGALVPKTRVFVDMLEQRFAPAAPRARQAGAGTRVAGRASAAQPRRRPSAT
jgi:LysR family transcriptional regulator, regulator for bpeEF and oprC